MNTIKITTSQNIDVEYELGSLGDRVLGRILDGLVIIAYCLIFAAIVGFGGIMEFIVENVWLVVIVIMLPILFYDLLCEMFLNGQSFGKKIMKIKVISLNGEQPTFSQYLIRWLFRLVDFSLSSSLVALVTVAVTDKRQRLGDIIAGTTLVKTTTRVNIDDTLYVQTAPVDYKVTYPEVINLNDRDIQLVKEVLINVRRSGNTMLAVEAQHKIESVLKIKNLHADPMSFLHVILADYNHLASQL
ncbi:MAG TPA: RDD family protein [Segetibacter sp.]|jgi:uncharacterized RDD family membrane protein YckC